MSPACCFPYTLTAGRTEEAHELGGSFDTIPAPVKQQHQQPQRY